MYTSYPEEIHLHYEQHGKNVPYISSKQGQALAWLSQPNMRGGVGWVTRESADKFFKDIGLKSGDPIQPFNKPGGSTPGLKLDKSKGNGFYSLKYPFEYPQVFAEAWPQELPVGVFSEPVHIEHLGELGPFVLADTKPVREIVPKVVATEREHREGVAANLADGPCSGGGLFR